MGRQYKSRIPGVIYVSPSQITTKRDCRRKWAYRYIDKIKTPQKPTQAFGTEGHDRNEIWLKHGKHPGEDDVGLVCQQGIKPGYLPTPSPDLMVEQYIEIPLFDGKAMMIGYMDCGVRPVPGVGGDPDEPPIVHDWKFTKDLRWAMSVAELREDAQPAIYGKWALDAFEVDEVLARWVYFCGRVNAKSEDGRPRTPRGIKKVEHLFPRAEIEARWEDCLDDAHEIMQMHATYKTAAEVPPNEMHCDAYGGCDHREYCPLSKEVGLGAALEQYDRTHKLLTRRINEDTGAPTTEATMSDSGPTLMEALQNRKPGEAPATAPPAEAPPATTPPPQAEAPAATPGTEVPAMFQGAGDVPPMFQGAGVPAKTPEPPAQTEAPPAKTSESGSFLEAMQAKQGAKGVNPPGDFKVDESETGPEGQSSQTDAENTAAEIAAEGTEVPPMFAHLNKTGRTTADAPNKSNAPKTEAMPEADAAAAAKETEKPKRKRKTKAEKAAEAAAVAESTVEAPRGGSDFIVAYNALPAIASNGFGRIVQLSDLLAPLLEHIAKEHRCKEHPNGVEHWNLIEYGNGKSVLAHLFAAHLDKHGFSGILVVDGNTPEGLAVKDALMRRADLVVQGVR